MLSFVRSDGIDYIELPAFATAHSHAFQRAMRGKAQRPGPLGSDDFWSWRNAMYSLAESLTPESIYSISKIAYAELARRGVKTVGEFHYVHHQLDGTPYAERTVLSEAVVRAARDEGLRIALLRVVYHRAGAGKAPSGAQRRFSDARLEDAFADVETLGAKFAGQADVVVGIAPHSVRAVPPEWLGEIARFADARKLPIHMHVAEQPAEVEACLAETGKRPVELLSETGLLSPRFIAVHATHLAAHEPTLLGAAGAGVCLCPTTERDLGDGLPDVSALVSAGVKLSVGVDSHVVTSPLDEIRGIELGERLRKRKRVTVPTGEESLASYLWNIGSIGSLEAVGFADDSRRIRLRRDHPDLALVDDADLLDAIVFSACPDVVSG